MFNKPFLLFYGAVDTYSGYGARSRDIVRALISMNKYDIKIISCKWGNCSNGFLKLDNPEHKQILDLILPTPQLPKQPDIYIMNSIPNEMQRIAKFNILITAGIETTICSAQWIEGLKNADLVLTSSEHSKKVFQETKFEKRENPSNKLLEVLENKTKIEVLFEGVNTEIYKKLDKEHYENNNNSLIKELNDINESFNFLFVGHWLQGVLGEDRKDVGMLIKTFLETFKNKKQKPGLILKVNGANCSIIDREDILNKINIITNSITGDLPNIYLLHGEFTDSEMNEIYNHPKIKSFVSFTKGEGFGRPTLEASITQKPIITSNWSGHLDFLNPEFNTLLPGEIKQIHPSTIVENMLIPESGWFTVNYSIASKAIEDVYKNYNQYFEKAKRQSFHSKTNFSLDKMKDLLGKILDENIPQQKPIILPTIHKLNLPTIIR